MDLTFEQLAQFGAKGLCLGLFIGFVCLFVRSVVRAVRSVPRSLLHD